VGLRVFIFVEEVEEEVEVYCVCAGQVLARTEDGTVIDRTSDIDIGVSRTRPKGCIYTILIYRQKYLPTAYRCPTPS
jgi:hypothetical protein